jgi:hypothetical protein
VVNDPHAGLRDQVLQNVLQGEGESDPSIRAAAAEGRGVPAELEALVGKIHNHAYRITGEDIARVQTIHGDDPLFEIIVSACLGASRNRLLAALRTLDEA